MKFLINLIVILHEVINLINFKNKNMPVQDRQVNICTGVPINIMQVMNDHKSRPHFR